MTSDREALLNENQRLRKVNRRWRFVAGSWGPDDTIVFVPQFNAGIWTVPAAGGDAKLLLATDESKNRIAYNHPQILPKGFSCGRAVARCS